MTEANKVAPESDANLEDLFNNIVNGDDSPADSDDVEDTLLGQAEDNTPTEADEEPATDDSEAQSEVDEENASDDKENVTTDSEDAQSDPIDDIWAGATDAQREAYLKLQHESQQLQNDVKANAGRVQGYSRKVNELKSQLEEARQQPQQPAKPENDVQLDGKSLQEIENDYPEIAQYVRHQTQLAMRQANQQIEPLKQQQERMGETLQHSQEQQHQDALKRELDVLYDAHPDYTQIRQAADFQQWLGGKSAGIQALARSYSAADNIELLNLYKSGRQPVQAPPTPTPVVQGTPKKDLSEHAEVPRKGAAPPQGAPEDPEELFNLIVSQRKN